MNFSLNYRYARAKRNPNNATGSIGMRSETGRQEEVVKLMELCDAVLDTRKYE
jgi:hypothetical protein